MTKKLSIINAYINFVIIQVSNSRNYEELDMNYIKTMKKYNVSTCIYGHLHGETAHKEVKEGDINEIDFKMVSCDYTDFDLIQLK